MTFTSQTSVVKDSITQPLFDKVWQDQQPELETVTFDDNRISFSVRPYSGSGSLWNIKGYSVPKLPMSVSFNSRDSYSGTIDIELDPSRLYDFVLKSDVNFHDLMSNLLDKKRLESNGLTIPPIVQGEVSYRTPLDIWRSLPRKMLDKVNAFYFRGEFWNIKYDDKETKLNVSKNSSQIEERKDFEFLKKELMGTGLVQYVELPKASSFKGNFEVIDKDKIKTISSLEALENLVKYHKDGSESIPNNSIRAELKLKGDFVSEDFALVGEIFKPKLDYVSSEASLRN